MNPENGTVAYEYDENGNLLSKLDARGVNAKYTYDALNRLVFRKYEGLPDAVSRTPSVTYSYDGVGALGGQNSLGKMTSVSSSVSTTFYDSFDEVGNIRSSRQVTDGVTYPMAYNYDLANNLVSQMYPSGRIVSTYLDAAGRVSTVYGNLHTSSKFYVSDIAYAPHGAIEALRLGNGLHEQVSFNSRLQPIVAGLGISKGDTSLWRLNYGYGTANNNGDLLSQSITTPKLGTLTQTYTYDPLNRLETAQENGGANWKQKFIYDRFGNRQVDAANTSTGTIPETPQISQETNRIAAAGYNYDPAGNLKTTAIGLTLDYDGENKQVLASKDGLISQYTYDGEGKRVKTVVGSYTTVFVYDSFGKLVGEYGNQSVEAATIFITQDHLGSARVVSGQDGQLKSRHDYSPFGEELFAGIGGRLPQQGYNGSDALRQKFASYERDNESGLDYAQARYYANTMGRFTSTDPLSASGMVGEPQSWNRYTYCINNPLRFVDPTGLIWGYKDIEGNRQFKWFDGDVVDEGWTVYNHSYYVGEDQAIWLDSGSSNFLVLNKNDFSNNIWQSLQNTDPGSYNADQMTALHSGVASAAYYTPAAAQDRAFASIAGGLVGGLLSNFARSIGLVAEESTLSMRGVAYELRHLNKHIAGTQEAARQLAKDGKAFVFNDLATLSRVEAEIFTKGVFTGTSADGWSRYGLRFGQQIGTRIGRDGSTQALHYGELKIRGGLYHIIPRPGPRR
jgi:RHS repeat-associated protein